MTAVVNEVPKVGEGDLMMIHRIVSVSKISFAAVFAGLLALYF